MYSTSEPTAALHEPLERTNNACISYKAGTGLCYLLAFTLFIFLIRFGGKQAIFISVSLSGKFSDKLVKNLAP